MKKKILISAVVVVILANLGFFGRLIYEGKKSREIKRSLDLPLTSVEPCPETPNCVSTAADPGDSEHFISTQTYTTNPIPEIARILAVLDLDITAEGTFYIVAEARSKLFGFVDDVDFVWNASTGQLEARSASRVGHSDLGANRKRLEGILFQLQQTRR